MKITTATKIAIDAMKKLQARYSVGHYAFLGKQTFVFAERDHKKYMRIKKAVEVLDAARD
jgi:hypothetical protein